MSSHTPQDTSSSRSSHKRDRFLTQTNLPARPLSLSAGDSESLAHADGAHRSLDFLHSDFGEATFEGHSAAAAQQHTRGDRTPLPSAPHWQLSSPWRSALQALDCPSNAWAPTSLPTLSAFASCATLHPAAHFRANNVREILSHPCLTTIGIPHLLVNVAWLSTSDTDALAQMRDPSGFIFCTVTRAAVDEYGPSSFKKGAVLLLRNVSVWAASGQKLLLVRPQNIVRVWS